MLALRRLTTLAAAGLVLLASGCGDGEGDRTTAAADVARGVSIEAFAFTPSRVSVRAGTTVTFTNRDGFAHTVTAKDRTYDSATLAEGETFTHAYDEPGTYPYFCAIHNSMTGSIVVE